MEGLGRTVFGGLPRCLEDALLPTFLPICDGTNVSLVGEGQCSASTRNEVFGSGADELTAMRLRLPKTPSVSGCKAWRLWKPATDLVFLRSVLTLRPCAGRRRTDSPRRR